MEYSQEFGLNLGINGKLCKIFSTGRTLYCPPRTLLSHVQSFPSFSVTSESSPLTRFSTSRSENALLALRLGRLRQRTNAKSLLCGGSHLAHLTWNASMSTPSRLLLEPSSSTSSSDASSPGSTGGSYHSTTSLPKSGTFESENTIEIKKGDLNRINCRFKTQMWFKYSFESWIFKSQILRYKSKTLLIWIVILNHQFAIQNSSI